jgi:hypothetical protein
MATDRSLAAKATEWVGAPIDRLEARLFHSQGETLADRAVISAMRTLGMLSRQAVSTQSVLETYRNLGCDVHSLGDVKQLPLDDVDRALQNFAGNYMVSAGLGGAIAGGFGPLGVVGGVPPLLFASLHAIHRLALFHGHDPEEASEEQFAVLSLATSLVSRPHLRTQVLLRLQTVARGLESPARASRNDADAVKITENVAEALAAQLVVGLLVRSWPVAGLVIGASYARSFVTRACDTARAAFGQRALLRRYGDVARVDAHGVAA